MTPRAALTALALISLACADAPLPAAPGAVVVMAAKTADVLAFESALLRAGLLGGSALAPLGTALVADAPIIASVMPTGAVVVATRVDLVAGRSLAQDARPVLGSTVAVALAGRAALVRMDGKRALVAFNVPAGDEATVAALLELMAADKGALTPALPAAGVASVRIEPAASSFGAVEGTVRIEAPATLVVAATLTAPSADARAAWASTAPPWACAVDEGAAAVLAIPPLAAAGAASADGSDGAERFEGRMLVAVYPPAPGSAEERAGIASVVIAGTPRGTSARDDLLDGLREGGVQARERTEAGPHGTRRFLDVPGQRRLRAVIDDRLFLLAVGEAAPVDRIVAGMKGACPVGVSPLVRVDGARLQKLLLPMLMTPDVVLRALAASPGEDTIPLARLRGLERLDVEARTQGEVVRIDGRVVLGSKASP